LIFTAGLHIIIFNLKKKYKQPAFIYNARSDTPKYEGTRRKRKKGKKGEKEKKKEKKKKKKEEEKRRRKQPTASHPSVKGQRPQERWIGAHWELQEANPLPNIAFRLRSALRVTGVLAVGGVVKNRYVYRAAQTPTRLLGRQMFRTPVCNEHATSTSRQNCVQIQYLNPSRLKPVARPRMRSCDSMSLARSQIYMTLYLAHFRTGSHL